MRELDIAIKAAKEAGKIHLKYFKRSGVFAQDKNPRDLVTIADKEAEQKIILMTKKHFPGHNILAEESGMHKSKSEYMWVIDALDGTGNFYRGHRDFCVLISLIKKNKIMFGLTWFPLTKELFIALKGKGATKNGKLIKVSEESNISKMYANTHMTSNLENRKLNLELYEKLLFRVRNIHVLNACIARSLTDIQKGLPIFNLE